jgi:hypothetical protein
MELMMPPPDLVPYGLRALKMVAMANGALAAQELALMDAAQRMFGTSYEVDALAPITPDELAKTVLSPKLRRQLVFGMLLMSLADGEASPREADVVESFAHVLGVDAHEIATFRNVSEGHWMTARYDVLRRFWVRPHLLEKVKREGAGWLLRAVVAFAGLQEDTAVAKRFRALEQYPEGTFGRAYASFIRDNHFSFPGERGSPPEPIVIHDLTHVIGGYGTEPADEICVTGFHAGYRKQEPFTFLLFSMMQFNLGIQVTPIAKGAAQQFDAARVLDALRRGAQMNIDLTDGSWDYWADMALPLDEVRAKYNVPPIGA